MSCLPNELLIIRPAQLRCLLFQEAFPHPYSWLIPPFSVLLTVLHFHEIHTCSFPHCEGNTAKLEIVYKWCLLFGADCVVFQAIVMKSSL